MKYLLLVFTVMVFVLMIASESGLCANSDTAIISIEVQPINEISITGSSVSLIISSATPGSQPSPVTDIASYDISTNCGTNAKRIIASIDSDMPSGTTLEIQLDAPSGASSQGFVVLSSTSSNVVTGIDSSAGSNLNITARFSATVEAGIVAYSNKTLTLTLSDS